MKYKKKICPICGKEFNPSSPNQKYCSLVCKRKSRYLHQSKKSKQLCWDCKRATGFCVWSAFRLPVKGWVANEHQTKDGIKTYNIVECPKFIEG